MTWIDGILESLAVGKEEIAGGYGDQGRIRHDMVRDQGETHAGEKWLVAERDRRVRCRR